MIEFSHILRILTFIQVQQKNTKKTGGHQPSPRNPQDQRCFISFLVDNIPLKQDIIPLLYAQGRNIVNAVYSFVQSFDSPMLLVFHKLNLNL